MVAGTTARRARWWRIGSGGEAGRTLVDGSEPQHEEVRTLVPLLVKPMEGRTGTTLLMALLGTSDEIVVDRAYPYENRYLLYLTHILMPAGEKYAPGTPDYAFPPWGMDELMLGTEGRYGPMPFQPLSLDPAEYRKRLVQHAWQAFSEATAAFDGRSHRYYAEKSVPRSIDLVADSGLEPRVLIIVRDPRDVVSSIRAFDEKRGSYGFGREPGSTEEEYLAFVVEQMRTHLTWIDGAMARYEPLLVRYEDLALDIHGVAAQLSEGLGVKLDPDRRAEIERHLGEHSTASSTTASVGRWKADLSTADADYIARHLEPWIEKFGYEPPGPG